MVGLCRVGSGRVGPVRRADGCSARTLSIPVGPLFRNVEIASPYTMMKASIFFVDRNGNHSVSDTQCTEPAIDCSWPDQYLLLRWDGEGGGAKKKITQLLIHDVIEFLRDLNFNDQIYVTRVGKIHVHTGCSSVMDELNHIFANDIYTVHLW